MTFCLLYRASSPIELWVLCTVMTFVVPPCGLISLLCLVLARRLRHNDGTSSVIVMRLELACYITIVIGLGILLATNFIVERLYRHHLLQVASVRCPSVGSNGTVWLPAVRSLPLSINDSAIKQRFLSGSVNRSVLQPSVDVKFSILRRNVNVFPVSNLDASSSFTSTEPSMT